MRCDATYVALTVDREQRAPLVGLEGDAVAFGGALGQPEGRTVVRDDLADREDTVALLDRLVEELIEIAGEIGRGRVVPRDELERTGRHREDRAERGLATLLTSDRRDQPATVEAEGAAGIVAAADLELPGLVRRVDELNDRLQRKGVELAA